MPRGKSRVPQPREWILTKRCCRCGQTKPWALFYPRDYWPDGSVRLIIAHCAACDVEITASRRRRRNLSADEWRKDLDYKNAWKRAKLARLRVERRRDMRVPVEPFMAWLHDMDTEPGALQELAERAGLHHDTLRKVFTRGFDRVSLRVVDAALTACGEHVRDLYPDEYEEAA